VLIVHAYLRSVTFKGLQNTFSMSQYTNHEVEHLSNAYLIGQYIESLAHEVILNQEFRLQKANNDLLVSTFCLYLEGIFLMIGN
jgi:hypothetical protein